MEKEQKQLVKDLFRAIADDEPRDVLLNLAQKAKIGLSRVWSEYQQDIDIVDAMEQTYINEPNWVIGWWSPEQAAKQLGDSLPTSSSARPEAKRPIDRPKKVLAIAEELKAKGNGRVTVEGIMEQLIAQGDQRPAKKMAISTGNILSWSKKWKRVAPGIYVAIEKEETK